MHPRGRRNVRKCEAPKWEDLKAHSMYQHVEREPWQHVMGDKQTILNRMHHYEMRSPMIALKEWGKIELNPLMWLTIWKKHINAYVHNEHSTVDTDRYHVKPRHVSKCLFDTSDLVSPKKMEHWLARKRLAEDFLADYVPPDCPGCSSTHRTATRCVRRTTAGWKTASGCGLRDTTWPKNATVSPSMTPPPQTTPSPTPPMPPHPDSPRPLTIDLTTPPCTIDIITPPAPKKKKKNNYPKL